MKALKITPENAAAIEAALAKVNGRGSRYAIARFDGCDGVNAEAYRAERKLEALGIPKSKRAGARFEVCSGGSVAKNYPYPRNVTSLVLLRRGPGWYLVEARGHALFSDQTGYGRLSLTAGQDAAAVALFRKAYEVQK